MWCLIAAALADPLYAERAGWIPMRSGIVADVPASAYASARAGQTSSGASPTAEGIDQVWGVAIFDAPVDAVWRALTDLEHFARWMPVDFSAALATPRRDGAIVFQYLSLPMVTDRYWCVEQDHNARLYTHTSGKVWELSWAEPQNDAACASLPEISGDGMPVRWSRGSWLLVDLGDRTLVEYATWSHPGGQLPAAQLARFAASRVPDTLDSLAAMARWEASRPKAGFYRPDGSAM